jgi:hypothetical protein
VIAVRHPRLLTKLATTGVVAGTGVIAATLAFGGSIAAADGPTCEGYKDVANHGEHVIEDYVLGAVDGGPVIDDWSTKRGIGDVVGPAGGAAVPGGPGPGFHFDVGAPPGASFCNPQAHSGGR